MIGVMPSIVIDTVCVPAAMPERLIKRRLADLSPVDGHQRARAIGGDGQLREARFEQRDLCLHLLAPAERDLVGAVAHVAGQRLDRLDRPPQRHLRLADVVEDGEVGALLVCRPELLQRRGVEPLLRELDAAGVGDARLRARILVGASRRAAPGAPAAGARSRSGVAPSKTSKHAGCHHRYGFAGSNVGGTEVGIFGGDGGLVSAAGGVGYLRRALRPAG